MEINNYPVPERLAIVTLTNIIDNWTETDTNHSPFFDKNSKALPEVESVGRSLNEIGGYDLMLMVCKEIPRTHRRELEFAWTGIGSWYA